MGKIGIYQNGNTESLYGKGDLYICIDAKQFSIYM